MRYWRPEADIIDLILKTYSHDLRDGDFLVISEKALSVALGEIFDESELKAGICVKVATDLVRKVWLFIGRICGIKGPFEEIASLPSDIISRHKALALKVGGIKHFLKPLSEAGIDASNLPLSYVSLPLRNPNRVADYIRERIEEETGRRVNVLIQDTDKSFLLKGSSLILTTRPSEVRGLRDWGALSYLLGMCLKGLFKAFPTPVGYSGEKMDPIRLLKIARAAEFSRGWGTGRDVFEMATTFGVQPNGVTWEMVEGSIHFPVVIVRLKGKKERTLCDGCGEKS
ncbi:MAG: coenzyme F420-0:L-glutamate ligase [Candidatus Korarchaeota archaeon]|nr:coenzyme F420-0:L-glutamate ligase [Candidatus Korarchaeota archaeon]